MVGVMNRTSLYYFDPMRCVDRGVCSCVGCRVVVRYDNKFLAWYSNYPGFQSMAACTEYR